MKQCSVLFLERQKNRLLEKKTRKTAQQFTKSVKFHTKQHILKQKVKTHKEEICKDFIVFTIIFFFGFEVNLYAPAVF